MPLPKPRDIQINGSWQVVRGQQILDSFTADAAGLQASKDLMDTLRTKIQNENWTAEEGANLLWVEVSLRGFRNMTQLEVAAIAEWDKTQTAEFREYMRLKDKYDT